MKILILEQEQIVKKDIERQLIKHGFDIVKDYNKEDFDVAIIGQFFYLEEMEKAGANLNPNARFFFLTTQKEGSFIEGISISARSTFISKPINTEVIVSLINYENVK